MFGRFVAPRLSLPLAAGVLLVLLSVLATLQYRWLGQVAEAERARLQAGARTRVERLADDFDREVTRAYAWLRVDSDMLGEGGGARYADRYERWSARTEHAGLVAGVFVAERAGGQARLRRFDTGAREFVEAEWSVELQPIRDMFSRGGEGWLGAERGGPRPPIGGVVEEIPALVIPMRAAPMGADTGPHDRLLRYDDGKRRPRDDGPRFVGPGPGGFGPRPWRGVTVVALDRGYIQRGLMPALVARHVAESGEIDYAVLVTSRRDPGTVIYRSDEAGGRRRADAKASLFEVRFDQVDIGVLRGGDPAAPAPMARYALRPDGPRPPSRDDGGRGRPRLHADLGLWEASVVHRGGSLEEFVAHVRRRNLAISFGILLLLGASAAMIVVSSQRARRLAGQQVEFVAGVSHELRTPVAVVCSAGENLADGLVRDPAEVRLYGATIRDEGRRLAEMVEQVLEFAGITSRERLRAREAVHLASVVQDALKASAVTLSESGAEVAVDVPSDLPPVTGDAAALRRAVQNLVQNAARHASAGRWIGISAEAAGSRSAGVVRLTVRDRGPGIAPADQARLFEPFFRGRQAITAGISGSGLGLSLVRRIVESHGGSVELETARGAGTAFTLVLPATPMPRLSAPSAEESDAQTDPAR
jgi:signal transduction histidine kinase